MKIIFDTFNKERNLIEFNIKTYVNNECTKCDNVYFKFSENLDINDNLLAIALSTLCGDKYEEIYYDLSIHEDVLNQISTFTKAKVMAKDINNADFLDSKTNDSKIILNFSGGFDSLAAKIILGDLAELVSVSFFGIEYDFFKKFKPFILDTNFRKLGYDRNHWTFMGVASILYSNFLRAKYHTFGTVLEASSSHVSKRSSLKNQFNDFPFKIAGLQDIKIIQSLTEIGTALIVCKSQPYLVNDSLKSLSNPRTEKRYRKELIVRALSKRFNLDVYLENTQPPVKGRRKNWGEYYAVDFLALYLIKYVGVEETSNIVNNIPQEAIDFVKPLKLEFYEKFMPDFLNNVPTQFKPDIIKNLAFSGIYPYNQEDYEELYKVLKFLQNYGHLKILN